MGVIMHKNVSYGGGSVVEPNPQESATEQLETLGIDGDVYEVTDANAIHTSDVGVANGVAELDANGKVPSSQLPSYVDDVLEYASRSAFPATGETGKIYVALDTNLTYRWGGSDYVEISPSLALGETSSTAYRGDRGKIAYDHSQSDHSGIKPAFTEASTRANIASGETIATIFGKIKKFFSDLKAVAFSGSYNDLSDKPTIPTVNNGTLTIQKNGTQVATFSANQSGNATANIECAVPSDVEGSKVATGNPLTITDAAGIKAEKIEIGFEPQQDKHGYNSVWVGGAGKNLLPLTISKIKSLNTNGTWTGNNYVVNGVTYSFNVNDDGSISKITVSGNNTTSSYAAVYLLDGNYEQLYAGTIYVSGSTNSNSNICYMQMNKVSTGGGSASIVSVIPNNTAYEFDSTDYRIQLILYFKPNTNANGYVYYPMVSKTNTREFEPYSNISPITGYTSLSANRCGKNLIGNGTQLNGFVNSGDMTFNTYSNSIGYYFKTSELPDTITMNATNGNRAYYGYFDDVPASGVICKSLNQSQQTLPNTISVNRTYKYIHLQFSYNQSVTNVQVEKGNQATPYDQFKGDNVTIKLGQTLYGGKLTILQDGSADVDVDTGFDVYDGSSDESWTASSTYDWNVYISIPSAKVSQETSEDLITNITTATSGSGENHCWISASGNLNVGLYKVAGGNMTSWRAFLANTNMQVAYKLANPFTIHLSPVETLTLLQGINNVWTDGTTLSLTYQPDNAIGQAKGTAQDAMAIANGLKPLYSTGSVGSGKTGSQIIAEITLPEAGIYYITGWARFTGNGKKAVWLWCEGSLSESWEDSTISTAEPKTFSTFAIYTASAAGKVVQVDSYTVSASNAVTGGIVAFKIA